MAESKMAEFKIRWLPSSRWVRMNSEVFLCLRWLNPWWQNSRWLPSSSWVRMNEWSFFVKMAESVGRFQDSCHHQVESEWMSEVFLLQMRELILASVSGFERKTKMAESNMAEFKMAAIIKLSQNEQVKFFVQNGWIQDWELRWMRDLRWLPSSCWENEWE